MKHIFQGIKEAIGYTILGTMLYTALIPILLIVSVLGLIAYILHPRSVAQSYIESMWKRCKLDILFQRSTRGHLILTLVFGGLFWITLGLFVFIKLSFY